MKRLFAIIVMLGALGIQALPAAAVPEVYTIDSPNALGSFDILLRITSNDHFDISSAIFDMRGTKSLGDGTPLVADAVTPVFNITPPSGGTATFVDGIAGDSVFSWIFTSFNVGDVFSFNLDPDIASNANYGAIISELSGTTVRLFTAGGIVSGTLGIDSTEHLSLTIPSASVSVSEPATLLLLGSGLAGLGGFGWRRHRRN